MRQLIVGNWKMHGLQAQLAEISAILAAVKHLPLQADVLICPPATLIAQAVVIVEGLIAIGGQDCHTDVDGPFTGDISAVMMKDAGASAVIVGHSERRQHHGETDAVVAKKATAAWNAGLLSIICIGENASQRRDGEAFEVCAAQIVGSVPLGSTAFSVAVAYEPHWAIGSGQSADNDDIAAMIAYVRQTLMKFLGAEGIKVRILYGGSVTASNAADILALAGVGGALVGGASLAAEDFARISRAALAPT